jgi:uroporphyrin-III C-methyltransferase
VTEPTSTPPSSSDNLSPSTPPEARGAVSPWSHRWGAWAAVGVTAVAVGAGAIAWNTLQRVKQAEVELVKRQQDAGGQATEARSLARQAEATSREAAAKVALLEARVAETSLQRTQIEELIAQLARSRDENLLADLEAALRVAMQQSSITGSMDPVAAALRQADERLARYSQPRLERVRRAVLQDLDRIKALGAADLPSLSIRVDEAIRQVDELPLISAVDRKALRAEEGREGNHEKGRGADGSSAAAVAKAPMSASAASAASSPAAKPAWHRWLGEGALDLFSQVWREARSLVRVTRIDAPEAALLAPDQAFFLRENLKLRLLNARLALMSRQFDIAQADLREAQVVLERYFDRNSKRVAATSEQLRLVALQSRQISVPRPEATLAALAAAAAGR